MAMTLRKSAAPFDIEVGGRLKRARMEKGVSQEKLGDALGITFQQIQKYEKGTNRIAPSRLKAAADFLKIPLMQLYGGEGVFEPDAVIQFGQTREGLRLARAWADVPPSLRVSILETVERIAQMRRIKEKKS